MLSFILLAAEEEELNGYHFAADVYEIVWGTLGFLVIMGILIKVAGPAVKKGFAGRTSRIETELADAKAAHAQAQESLVASTADLPDVAVEAENIRTEAHETAARLKVDMVEKAKADAEALRARNVSDIENSKRQALADLRDEVGRLTRNAAEAVVVDNLDAAAHGDLIEGYITQVNQL